MTARCPVCTEQLHVDQVDGCDVRACGSCGGMWIGALDLHALVQPGQAAHAAGGLPVEDVTVRADRRCPYCADALRTATDRRTSTQVDWCNQHGVWLDASELDILRGRIKAPKPGRGAAGSGDGERSRGIVGDVAWFFGSLFV
jgi:Zn-finger nucleic acid-binding protein